MKDDTGRAMARPVDQLSQEGGQARGSWFPPQKCGSTTDSAERNVWSVGSWKDGSPSAVVVRHNMIGWDRNLNHSEECANLLTPTHAPQAPLQNYEQSANIPGNLKLWSKNTHTGRIYPALRHTIIFFLATVILACNTHHGYIRIRVPLHIMPAFSTVEIIQLKENEPCHAPLFKKARGRPQTARLTAREQRTRLAAYNGALENIPDRVQRCSRCREEGHNVTRCPTLPAGL